MDGSANDISNPAKKVDSMGVGGQLITPQHGIVANLVRAYSGPTRFREGGWAARSSKFWVLDYIHQGQQLQRVGSGKGFLRPSGVAALYRPRTIYHEVQSEGLPLDESYILFSLGAKLRRSLDVYLPRNGALYFQDPEQILADRLRQLGKLLFYRRSYFELIAHGIFLELLGLLLSSEPLQENQRRIGRVSVKKGDCIDETEKFIRKNISEVIHVKDLAAHSRMSLSSFAHTYRQMAGESPYHAVMRLKIETSKRFLVQEELSVKEVARKLGFSSEFHFSRLFKKLEGLSPRNYAQTLQKELF